MAGPATPCQRFAAFRNGSGASGCGRVTARLAVDYHGCESLLRGVASVSDEWAKGRFSGDPLAGVTPSSGDDLGGRPTLESLELLGDGYCVADQLHQLMGRSRFFSDFTREDMEFLSRSLEAYRAQKGQIIIREGSVDDFMLFVISGHVEIAKRGGEGVLKPMTRVGPGATLGEMSMIDGEPRSAFCIAAEPVIVAVLRRDAMVRIVLENPGVGAKVLLKLVTMLSARLRQAGATLLLYG